MSRKEGGKIFGSGSRAPIAISILVKNPLSEKQGQIYFHDIGDYLTREEKLEKIAAFGDIDGIAQANGWKQLVPDAYGDWLNQRDPNFSHYLVLGDKKGIQEKLFDNYSLGVNTSRDPWCYNASQQAVASNMRRMIGFYNTERERFNTAYGTLDKTEKTQKIDSFINSDPQKISWSSSLKPMLTRNVVGKYHANHLIQSVYRPFTKQWLYYDNMFNDRTGQMPRIFPDATVENRVICVSGIGAKKFSALIANKIPCLDMIEKGQCFPLWLYEPATSQNKTGASPQTEMFDDTPEKGLSDHGQPAYTRKDAITDAGLAHFRNAYPCETISKDDIFYYVYGLLHSEDYRTRYADNLMKELPRIPCVKTAAAFRRFSEAGRQLAELHLNYETVTPYPLQIVDGADLLSRPEDYRVTKMRYGGKTGKEKDLTTIIYNDHITLRGIPPEAYDYVVNGKPALDWVVERQAVTTDKASGIVNDANDWAIHTMHNPKYPLELVQRIITVSLETMKIVRNLPELDI